MQRFWVVLWACFMLSGCSWFWSQDIRVPITIASDGGLVINTWETIYEQVHSNISPLIFPSILQETPNLIHINHSINTQEEMVFVITFAKDTRIQKTLHQKSPMLQPLPYKLDYLQVVIDDNDFIPLVDRLTVLILYAFEECEVLEDLQDVHALLIENCALVNGNDKIISNRDDLHAKVNYAWQIHSMGETVQGIEFLTELLESTVNNDEQRVLLQARSQLHALNFNYTTAIEDIDQAIAIAPENAGLYQQRGDTIMLVYEWDRALVDYNHAIELDSMNANTYFKRGVLLYTMARREAALFDFETALELAPNGRYASQATQYIQSIPLELEALNQSIP